MKQAMAAAMMLAAVLAGWPAAGADTAENLVDPRAWTELDIVPMPKEIRLTDNDLVLDPGKAALVIGADACEQSRIGADWINRRLAAVGGTAPLPIITGTEIPAGKTAIIIGTVEDNPLIARAAAGKTVNVGENKNPGERGYEIRRSADGKTIFLAGADNIGALYACVTFGELLEMRDGQAAWRSAAVRDWPDLIWLEPGTPFAVGNSGMPEVIKLFSSIRQNENPTPALAEDYLRAIRDYYDRLMRRKFGLLQYYGFYPRGQIFKPLKGLEVVRAGVEYGRARGVEAIIYAEKPYAGLRSLHPEIQRDCPKAVGPHRDNDAWLRCWSLDEITRETARNFAEFIRATGVTQVGMHDTDSGWLTNPANWEDRCDVCRARWGDDYVAATINKHKIYYEEVKKLNPSARLHFTIYPYGVEVLDPELGRQAFTSRFGDTPEIRAMAERYRQYYTEFWRRLHAAFPADDVTFCIREAPAPAIRAWRELTPGRGMFAWYALMSHSWRPLFSMGAAWSATFVDNPRDTFGILAYLDGFLPLEGLAVREYSWNRDTPGALPWGRLPDGTAPGAGEQWRYAEPHGPIYDLILPRLARNYFGGPAASNIAAALSENVDLQQIFNRQRPQFTWLKNAERMQWQADNAARGTRAMDELWAKIVADPARLGLDDFTMRRVINLRERLHMGMWTARARACDLRARELAAEQKRAEAESAAAQGLDDCRQGALDRAKLLRDRPEDAILAGKDSSRWAGLWREDMADRADFAWLEERLNRTLADLPSLSSLGALPKPVLDALAHHRLARAMLVHTPVVIDGLPDEPAWADAAPLETFMLLHGDAPQPARAHTRLKLLFDATNLYALITAWAPGDQPVADDDTVELFLAMPGGDYAHWFIQPDGRLRQQLNQVEITGGVRSVAPDNDWKCPGLACAVKRGPRSWQAELRIPAAGLGTAFDARGWLINAARIYPLGGGEHELSSLQKNPAEDFHDLGKFPALTWTREAAPALAAHMEVSEFKLATMTLPDSVASVASFLVHLDSDRALHGVKLEAEAYDHLGRLQTRKVLAEVDRIMYRWQSPGPCVVEYRQVYEQGGIRLRLTAAEGQAERWIKFGGWEGAPPASAMFAPKDAGRSGLADACRFSDRLRDDAGVDHRIFNEPAGTVEFWFKPVRDWSPVLSKGAIAVGEYVFLHYGPIRKDNPRITNNSPLVIRYARAGGRLDVSLLNAEHAGWQTHARLADWPADAWRHVAVLWDAAAEESNRVRVYVDGKKLSGAPARAHPERMAAGANSVVDTRHPFAVQVGALNSGWQAMEGVMRDLRISRIARYQSDFTPPAGAFELDADTSIMFAFDGNLEGKGMAPGGAEYRLAASPGCAGM